MKYVNASCVYVFGALCIHLPLKGVHPSSSGPQLVNGPNTQFSRKEKKRAYRVIESLFCKT